MFTDPIARKKFKALARRYNVPTMGAPIINLWLSFDSAYVLALCVIRGKGQDCVEMRAYDIDSGLNEPAFTVEYTGKYLKMLTIEQNQDGKMFALPYNDHGKFFVGIVNSELGKQVKQINVNHVLNIDEESIPIDGVKYPMISCCFTSPNVIFVSIFHRFT